MEFSFVNKKVSQHKPQDVSSLDSKHKKTARKSYAAYSIKNVEKGKILGKAKKETPKKASRGK